MDITQGYNTDYTGFIAAYEQVRAGAKPGVCCLVGTGALGAPWPLGWSSWAPMKFAYLIVTAPKRSS